MSKANEIKATSDDFVTVEVWVVLGSSGDTAIGSTEDDALAAFEENVGTDEARRVFKLVTRARKPQIVTVGLADVPDEDETVEAA